MIPRIALVSSWCLALEQRKITSTLLLFANECTIFWSSLSLLMLTAWSSLSLLLHCHFWFRCLILSNHLTETSVFEGCMSLYYNTQAKLVDIVLVSVQGSHIHVCFSFNKTTRQPDLWEWFLDLRPRCLFSNTAGWTRGRMGNISSKAANWASWIMGLTSNARLSCLL